MANLTTFGDIKNLALHQADMENSSYPTTARLNQIANIALSKTRDLLIDSHEDYFRKVQSITLASGTEQYALPDDYYKTLKVFYVTQNRRYPLERYTYEGVAGFKTSPAASGTVEHWYIPEYKDLNSDNDVIDISVPVGWEDYASLLIALRLLVKEESPVEELKRECSEARQHIIDMAPARDTGTALPVADATGRWNHAYDLFPFEGRRMRYRIMGRNMLFADFEYLGA